MCDYISPGGFNKDFRRTKAEGTVEILYFTLAGIALYLLADWLLDRIERARGVRFEHRTFIFFTILLALAVAAFQAIGYLTGASG